MLRYGREAASVTARMFLAHAGLGQAGGAWPLDLQMSR